MYEESVKDRENEEKKGPWIEGEDRGRAMKEGGRLQP